MSKKVKTIVIGAAVIVVLAAATAFLLLWPKEEEAAVESSSESTTITIANQQSDQLKTATIQNAKDEFTIELVGELMWRIKDIQDFPANESAYVSTRNSLCAVSAMEIVEENSADLSVYGLTDPAETVSATFLDGSSYQIALGDLSPDGSRRYALRLDENNKTVYGLSSSALGSAALTRYDFLDNTIIPAFSSEDQTKTTPTINGMTLAASYLDTPIVVEELQQNDQDLNSSMDTLKMTSPVKALINTQWFDEKIIPLFGLTASRVAKAAPTAEELKDYGLDAPYMTLTLRYEDTSSFKLMVGSGLDAEGNKTEAAKDMQSYYVMKEGSELIYVVPSSSLLWLGAQPKNVISSIITLPNVKTVDSIELKLDGQSHLLKITQTPNEDPEKADDPDQNVFHFELDGKVVKDDLARKFYQVLLSTSIQNVNTSEPAGDPVLTIVYNQNTGRKETVDFYVLPDLTTIVALNGNPSYIGRSGMVDKVRKELVHLQNGEAIDVDY